MSAWGRGMLRDTGQDACLLRALVGVEGIKKK